MTIKEIVDKMDFEEVADAQLDSKKRITLKKIKSEIRQYKIYVNTAGQIILDPQVMIPASEAWLFKNKKALAAVRKGLEESAAGKVVERKSMAKHADDKID